MLGWTSFSLTEGLVENVKVKGRLGCSNHEIVEFKLLRAERRSKTKLTWT